MESINFNFENQLKLDFKGKDDEFSDSVALNVAAGLIISDKEKDFKRAYEYSKQYLKSGDALCWLGCVY